MRLEGGGVKQKGKGLTDTDNSAVIAGEGDTRGLNGNGKNTIKIKLKNKKNQSVF